MMVTIFFSQFLYLSFFVFQKIKLLSISLSQPIYFNMVLPGPSALVLFLHWLPKPLQYLAFSALIVATTAAGKLQHVKAMRFNIATLQAPHNNRQDLLVLAQWMEWIPGSPRGQLKIVDLLDKSKTLAAEATLVAFICNLMSLKCNNWMKTSALKVL